MKEIVPKAFIIQRTMRGRWLNILLLAMVLSLPDLSRKGNVSPTPVAAQTFSPAPSAFMPAEVLVRLRPGANPNRLHHSLGSDWRGQEILTQLDIIRLRVPTGQVSQTVYLLNRSPEVIFAEPNYILHAQVITPSDPGWPSQYGPIKIQAPQAWEITTGSISVTIAIVDTGVDLNHPDLAEKIWNNAGEIPSNGVDDDANGYLDDWRGWDFANNDNNPQDDYGHGTHVAGIAAATSNNGIGITGVAWGARLMSLKILDQSGNGTNADLALALHYAVDNGAQIINLSVGDPPPDPVMEEAVNYAYTHGAVVIAAAGNSGAAGVYYPGAYANAIAVAATDANNKVALFSSYGLEVDLAAPGSSIYSTYWISGTGSTFATLSGTSMATPHVSGVAALLASLPQFNSPDKIRAALEETTLDIGFPCRDIRAGAGLVQAWAALQFNAQAAPRECRLYYFPLLQLP